MKRQVVILDIAYDETEYDPPSQWDWPVLLETPVEVVLTGVLTKGDLSAADDVETIIEHIEENP